MTALGYALAVGGFDSGQQGIALVTMVAGSSIIVIGQWRILRLYVPNAFWWLVATPIGAVLGFICVASILLVVAVTTHMTPSTLPHLPAATLLLGQALVIGVLAIVIGVCQWVVLRGSLQHSVIWILVNGAAAVVSGICNVAFNLSAKALFDVHPYVLQGAVVGLVAGAMTGGVLVRYLRISTPTPRKRS